MNHAKLLDCTLRDGAYVIDKYFGDDVIRGITSGLVRAGVDIIEIGFLQDEGQGPGKTVYKNSRDARPFIPEQRGDNTLFAVLADYSRYTISNLDPYDGRSFDAVRICFFKHERYDALEYFKAVKEKGYKLFVQPVDALGYTDAELVEFIELVNEIEPYCFSIVDTFGSMFEDDMQRLLTLVHHNLTPKSRIGFHSHNNMQMSNALSQAALKITAGSRNMVIDATISGMGRGAGNTPTELIAQYMVKKLRYHYNVDELLDIIDDYIEPIRQRASWGYSTNMFLSGAFSSHVNNVAYLQKKNSIRSRDIRYILNRVDPAVRKRYDYDLLDEVYLERVGSEVDDRQDFEGLKSELEGRNVVIVAPGKSVSDEDEKLRDYIRQNDAVVISINFLPETIRTDYLYMNNIKRYEMFQQKRPPENISMILTSNIRAPHTERTRIVSFSRLFKCGWQYADNSAILLLRLVDQLGAGRIGIAGLDGYDPGAHRSNYAQSPLERHIEGRTAIEINREISEMLQDFYETRGSSSVVEFITNSQFDGSAADD